ncbi:MAG: 30S ribosomal protein S2 [Patescibacteria group bacterium]
MTTSKTQSHSTETIDSMFKAGAHYAFSRSRRHPTLAPFIFGVKNHVEIFDLEKTNELLEKAKDFVRTLATEGKQILLVGGKSEARDAIKRAAAELDMPYVVDRWLGGTLSNFKEIRSRVEKLLDLTAKREKGELSKYTKKERLLIDREIEKLERFFSGLVPMKELPKALFVIDSKHEHIAVTEARKAGIPVIALMGSDCNIKTVDYAIPGNDASIASVAFFVDQIVWAYKEGRNEKLKKAQNA